MSDTNTSLDSPPSTGERPEVGGELDVAREEILRLRDLLIAKDAELGAAKGRLAELESRHSRLIKRLEVRLLTSLRSRVRMLRDTNS